MLTRLIVASYVWLLEIALWLALIVAAVVGFNVTVPMLNNAGAVLTNEFAWKLCGALLSSVIAFLVLTIVTGPFLVLLDVRQAIRNIDAKLERSGDASKSLPRERREPTL